MVHCLSQRSALSKWTWVPHLPRKTKVDVRLCHACHVKRRWMSPSATPVWKSVCVDKVRVDKVCVDKACVDKVSVDKVCVDKVCVDQVCVDKVCVDKVCVDKVCVCVDKKRRGGRRIRRRRRRRRSPGYRIKNKNPTQSCGEGEK